MGKAQYFVLEDNTVIVVNNLTWSRPYLKF